MIEIDTLLAPSARGLGHHTAKRAVDILLDHDSSYHCPSRRERDAMLEAFARHRKILYGAAFDVVRTARAIDLLDVDDIAANLDAITICEIKSTNRPTVKNDLKGYFFNITAGELLTAQSVGERYRFVFVNTKTGEHQELGLNEVLGRARGLYPAWHIRF